MTQENKDILQAFLDGKKIEILINGSNCFIEVDNDFCRTFDFTKNKYRIKKQPKKRLLTPMDLFERGATHILVSNRNIEVIQKFTQEYIVTHSFTEEVKDIRDYKWTSDRKTWNSFEVEE